MTGDGSPDTNQLYTSAMALKQTLTTICKHVFILNLLNKLYFLLYHSLKTNVAIVMFSTNFKD